MVVSVRFQKGVDKCPQSRSKTSIPSLLVTQAEFDRMKQILVGLSLKTADSMQLGGGAFNWQVQGVTSAAAVDAFNISFQAVTLRY